MKNRQLMRLNKVLHNGVVKTVDCIAAGHASFIEDIPKGKNYSKWVDLDEVEFIPISDDILTSLGIVYDESHGCYTIEITEGELYYYVNKNDDNIFTIGFSDYPVRFIHELQNVFLWDLNFTLNMDSIKPVMIEEHDSLNTKRSKLGYPEIKTDKP